MTSIRSLMTVAWILFSSFPVFGQVAPGDPPPTVSPDGVWQRATSVRFRDGFRPPSSFSAWTLDVNALKGRLADAPRETFGPIPPHTVLYLPLPDGSFVRVAVAVSQLMEPALAERFRQLSTYVFHGIGTGRGSGEEAGTIAGQAALGDELNAWYLAASTVSLGGGSGLLRLEPVDTADGTRYLSFFDHARTGVPDDLANPDDEDEDAGGPPVSGSDTLVIGDQLRIYRLAAATTGEFYLARCNCTPDEADTLLAKLYVVLSILADLIGVNALFEPELSVRVQLADGTSQLLYNDPEADPFDNSEAACDLASDNLTNTQAVLGEDEYDVGLVLAAQSKSGNNGCAKSGGVCSEKKAGTASKIGNDGTNSASSNMAHELGHKLGGSHTFSGQAGKCTETQFASHSAYEPGSGTTRMSYRKLCDDDDVDTTAVSAGTYFHSRNIDQIFANVFGGGEPSTCGFLAASNNVPPSVNAGSDYTIPQATPFTLSPVSASDNEPLAFTWEQFDLAETRRPIDSADLADGPIVRSVPPGTDADRTVPRLQDLLDGVTRKGEVLSNVDREMNFRFIARDNMMGGGGIAYDSMRINVEGDPFFIASPNSGLLQAGCQAPLTWQVGGGSVAPFASVLFSTDGGQNFDTVIAGPVANDGAFDMLVPCSTGNEGRIKLQSIGNIFFDITDQNLSVVNSPPVVQVAAADGAVSDTCEFTLAFSAKATDTCGLSATNVSVELIKGGGDFTLGAPALNINQVSPTEVEVTGNAVVSNLLNSPAQVTVKVRAADACGAITDGFADVHIVDDTPPNLSASVNPTVLWPANHAMAPVGANVAFGDNCPVPNVVLTSITSSEPDDGVADGNTINDIQQATFGMLDTNFLLRAERAGNGPGRVYTVLFTATDGSGNESQAAPTVTVPLMPPPN